MRFDVGMFSTSPRGQIARQHIIVLAGLTGNQTYGQIAQIGTSCSASVIGLQGDETLGGWSVELDGITVAATSDYTPVEGDDAKSLRIGRLINNEMVWSSSYDIRHAPPVADNTLPDQVWIEGTAITPLDTSVDFSGGQITFSLAPLSAALPSGLTMTNSGIISGTPTGHTEPRMIVIRATNSGGDADSVFQMEVSQVVSGPSIWAVSMNDATDTANFTTDSTGTLHVALSALNAVDYTSASGNFTVGQILSDGTASAKIVDQVTAGNTGRLLLGAISNAPFADQGMLSDGATGTAIAQGTSFTTDVPQADGNGGWNGSLLASDSFALPATGSQSLSFDRPELEGEHIRLSYYLRDGNGVDGQPETHVNFGVNVPTATALPASVAAKALCYLDPSDTDQMWQEAAQVNALASDGQNVGYMGNAYGPDFAETSPGAGPTFRSVSNSYWLEHSEGDFLEQLSNVTGFTSTMTLALGIRTNDANSIFFTPKGARYALHAESGGHHGFHTGVGNPTIRVDGSARSWLTTGNVFNDICDGNYHYIVMENLDLSAMNNAECLRTAVSDLGSTWNFQGDIFSFILTNALSVAERTELEAFLAEAG